MSGNVGGAVGGRRFNEPDFNHMDLFGGLDASPNGAMMNQMSRAFCDEFSDNIGEPFLNN